MSGGSGAGWCRGGGGVMVTLWGDCTTFSENLSISLVSATGGLSAVDSGV